MSSDKAKVGVLPLPPNILQADSSTQRGVKALSGEEHEHFKLWLFGADQNERKISCRGESIIVYDPSKEEEDAYWEGENITINTEAVVPAGHVVRVINAWVVFIKPQAEAA